MADQKIQIIISAASRGLEATFGQAGKAVKAFRAEVSGGSQVLGGFRSAVAQTVGALGGLFALSKVNTLLMDAEKAAFGFESSLRAANRQFNVGSLGEWEASLARISSELRIYSNTELKNAAARTVDMTKRLGLSQAQMEQLIVATADLSSGKVDLEGGIERVTAALRGEAESAELLGLTLNEDYVKAWYAASDATGKAWKDLTDMEKAQVRYNLFLEQALPFQGKAAESVNTLAGAYKLMTTEITNSIQNNKDVVAAMKAVAAVFRDNGSAIGEFVGQVVGLIAKTVEFIAKHGEAVKVAGLFALGMLALAKTITTVTAIVSGLNAGFIVLAGEGLVSFVKQAQVATTVSGLLQGSILTVRTALASLVGVVGAAAIGIAIGSWLNSFEAVRKTAQIAIGAVIVKVKELQAAYYEAKIAAKGMVGGDTAADEKKVAAIRQEIALYESVIERIKKHGTEYQAAGKAGKEAHEQAADAARQSADTQKQAQGAAIEEMKKKYKEYADQVKKLQDEIAGRERTLQAELREMGRTGMSDLGAWRDRRREAEQYYLAAQRAAQAGKFDEAVQLADEAKAAYKDLNSEVKEGEVVQVSAQKALKTSMAGVKQAGDLAISILEQQKAAAQAAADEMDKAEGGKLSGALNEAKQAALDLDQVIKDSGGDWGKVWDEMGRNAAGEIDEVEQRIVKLTRDRNVTIYVNEVVKKALGGMIGRFAGGGRLPGYGGGDRIPALLEAGEFIVRKEAVSKFGSGMFAALNSLRLPKFAAGGAVGGGGGAVYNLNVSFAGDVSPMSQRTARENARLMLREMQTMQRVRS